MSVAKNLRLLRRIRGLTLEELSEKVGISVSYLSRIESGNRRVTEPLLFKLCELLECDLEEILSDEPPEKQIASLGFASLNLRRKGFTEVGQVNTLMQLLEKVAGQLQHNASAMQKLPLFTSHYFKNPIWFHRSQEQSSVLEGLPLNEPTDWIPCPPSLLDVPSAFAYAVVDDDMSPRYNPGDIVFVNPQKPLIPGCFVVLIQQDDTVQLRQFIRSEGQGLTLKSYQKNQEEVMPVSTIKGVYRLVGVQELA